MTEAEKTKARAIAKERYEWLKDKGYCVECGHAKAGSGFVKCPDCLYKDSLRAIKSDPEGPRWGMKRLRDQRIQEGLCVDCGQPAREGRRKCERCAKRHYLLYTAPQQRAKYAHPTGICRRVGCEKPVAEGTKHCAEHLAEMRANMAENRSRIGGKYSDG